MESLSLTSSAFLNGGDIPDLYTCRGKNISPPLSFSSAPAGTKSHALVMVDLDTPVGTVTHWVVYNIPVDFGELAQGLPPGRFLKNSLNQGRNGTFRFGYMGPCPPWGRHRYLFRLFALDAMIPTHSALNRRKLLRLMDSHILAETALLGYYPKKGEQI
jgi:Raf kinase inhibitor-like YbhB/YbcL family protein